MTYHYFSLHVSVCVCVLICNFTFRSSRTPVFSRFHRWGASQREGGGDGGGGGGEQGDKVQCVNRQRQLAAQTPDRFQRETMAASESEMNAPQENSLEYLHSVALLLCVRYWSRLTLPGPPPMAAEVEPPSYSIIPYSRQIKGWDLRSKLRAELCRKRPRLPRGSRKKNKTKPRGEPPKMRQHEPGATCQ